MSTIDEHREALLEQLGDPLESSVEAVLADLAFALGWLDIKSREIEGQLKLQQEMGQFQDKIWADRARLREQRAAVLVLHHVAESRSINTLSCEAHNVTKGPPAWRDEPDYDACPDCVVTPITVCSHSCCEEWPCRTAQALGVTE